jgi:hypothetical protein
MLKERFEQHMEQRRAAELNAAQSTKPKITKILLIILGVIALFSC